MVERISVEEAQKRMTHGWTYLDVRSVPEFEEGHPAGAYNIPFMHLGPNGAVQNPRFLEAVENAFDKTTALVLGCQSGRRSLRAARLLEEAGWSKLSDLRPGWGGCSDAFGRTVEAGWASSNLPVARRAEAGRSWVELAPKSD